MTDCNHRGSKVESNKHDFSNGLDIYNSLKINSNIKFELNIAEMWLLLQFGFKRLEQDSERIGRELQLEKSHFHSNPEYDHAEEK